MLVRQHECHSYYRDVHYYDNKKTVGWAYKEYAQPTVFLLATTPLDATNFVVVKWKSNRNFDNYIIAR